MPISGARHGRPAISLGARLVAGFGLGLLALAGCQSTDNQVASSDVGPVAAGETNEGSFSMSLTLAGTGFRFATLAYDVSGNGFQKSGSIDVSGSAVVSTVIGGIPLGSGYTLNLRARDVDNKLTPCVGSASFDLTTATTVAVPVHLTCREVAAPPSVPVPGWVAWAVALSLLALGASRARRRA